MGRVWWGWGAQSKDCADGSGVSVPGQSLAGSALLGLWLTFSCLVPAAGPPASGNFSLEAPSRASPPTALSPPLGQAVSLRTTGEPGPRPVPLPSWDP